MKATIDPTGRILVLTRLPGDPRVGAEGAVRLIDGSFPKILTLAPGVASSLHTRLARAGIVGGAVYDGLGALAAIDCRLSLATRDARARTTLRGRRRHHRDRLTLTVPTPTRVGPRAKSVHERTRVVARVHLPTTGQARGSAEPLRCVGSPNQSGFHLVGVTGFELPPQALSPASADYRFQRGD